ncbi:hypothetical protein [Pseudoalteromonas nigrifaciens]|uniref:hypothetical protein n=1 Tax=Pseudoalteromonas nigrifaciens TaxID=28109 RepID=UPI003FD4303E
MNKTTKTEDTKQAYLTRAKRVISRFEKHIGKAMTPDQPDFIPFFLAITKNKSQSNWRQLKASLVYFFQVSQQGKLESSLLSLDVNHEDTTKKSEFNLTSSRKKKSISESELNKLRKFLIASGGRENAPTYDKALMCIFNGSIATGLRPVEWSTATVLDESPEGVNLVPPILKVKNAKSTNGRSYGPYRYLGLSSLSELNIKFVQLAVNLCAEPVNMKGESITFDVFYKNCRDRFYYVVDQVFKKPSGQRITLYTARHQFIANLKKAGYPLEEIACLVGHGNDLTASKHYGKRRNGSDSASGFPIANKADILKVRAKYHHFAQSNNQEVNRVKS